MTESQEYESQLTSKLLLHFKGKIPDKKKTLRDLMKLTYSEPHPLSSSPSFDKLRMVSLRP